MLLCSTSGCPLANFGILIKDPAIVTANSISITLAAFLPGSILKTILQFILILGEKMQEFENKNASLRNGL